MRQSSLEQQLFRTEEKLIKGKDSLPGEWQAGRNCMACDMTFRWCRLEDQMAAGKDRVLQGGDAHADLR